MNIIKWKDNNFLLKFEEGYHPGYTGNENLHLVAVSNQGKNLVYLANYYDNIELNHLLKSRKNWTTDFHEAKLFADEGDFNIYTDWIAGENPLSI